MCQKLKEQFIFSSSSLSLKLEPFPKWGFHPMLQRFPESHPTLTLQTMWLLLFVPWRLNPIIEASQHLKPSNWAYCIRNMFLSLTLLLMKPINPPSVFCHFSLYGMIFFFCWLSAKLLTEFNFGHAKWWMYFSPSATWGHKLITHCSSDSARCIRGDASLMKDKTPVGPSSSVAGLQPRTF